MRTEQAKNNLCATHYLRVTIILYRIGYFIFIQVTKVKTKVRQYLLIKPILNQCQIIETKSTSRYKTSKTNRQTPKLNIKVVTLDKKR